MIRQGTEKDIDQLMDITFSCAQHMISKGIFQWNEHYPNRSAFEKDAQRNELYVLEIDDTVIGIIVLSTHMDQEYKDVQWLTENNNHLYVHRLAIQPKHQGQGHAQQLMDFAENYAKVNNFDSIRLDTFSQNPRNQKFYEQRGYQRLGSIYFPKQSEHPFYCYELVL